MLEKPTEDSFTTSKHLSSKIEAIESTLHQTIYNFRDLVGEIQQMQMMTESAQKEIIVQNEKCESKCCRGAEELKNVIESKENIIQLVASALTKLNETKNLNILPEMFRIICGESKPTYIAQEENMKEEKNLDSIKIEGMSITSPKEDLGKEESLRNMSLEEREESVCEIEGTPTGRRSPIIQSKKLKTSTPNNTLREKKKCPQNWLTPEKKSMKVTLSFATPTRSKGTGRLRQQRITLVREKPSTLVDLTTTPQFSKGRNSQVEERLNGIKQEATENDDTIMPSPTSGPVFPPAFKSLSKDSSPQKFKKPLSLRRVKAEKTPPKELKENLPNDVSVSKLEESVNLLKEYPDGLLSPKKCRTPSKSAVQADSASLLLPFNNIDAKNTAHNCNSPVKRPLVENLNAVNIPCDNESSMSILRRDVKLKSESSDDVKRTKGDIELLYKEPTVRKKAEKRALPGWCCDECKIFWGELYKDDLEMQAKKMQECSKHRGRNNPLRPKTPPGYWEPRWDVPDDTEEFNRRNNAV